MPFAKGTPKPPTSGRRKGVPTKARQAIRDRPESMGCDYIGYLANTVMNKIPCVMCDGEGKTKYQPLRGDKPGIRMCQSCWGKKKERIDPKASQAAAATLLEYCETKLKAIEHTGADGGPIEIIERLNRGLARADALPK